MDHGPGAGNQACGGRRLAKAFFAQECLPGLPALCTTFAQLSPRSPLCQKYSSLGGKPGESKGMRIFWLLARAFVPVYFYPNVLLKISPADTKGGKVIASFAVIVG